MIHYPGEVDWEGFRERLEPIWHGDWSDDPAGRKPCDAVLVCKLLALGSLPHASYVQMQKNALADHTWRRFPELTGIELPPDKNTLGVDADRLAESGEMVAFFADFLAQMAAAGAPRRRANGSIQRGCGCRSHTTPGRRIRR